MYAHDASSASLIRLHFNPRCCWNRAPGFPLYADREGQARLCAARLPAFQQAGDDALIDANTSSELALRKPFSGQIRAKNGHGRIMHNVHSKVKTVYSRGAFAISMHRAHHPGMKLRAIRESKGLSQAQLGELIGKNQATIQRAETMHKSAKLETYIACADALGVDLGDIFSDSRSDEEALLVIAYRSASSAARSRVLADLSEAESLPTEDGSRAKKADKG